MKCMHEKSNNCDGKANGLYCYIKRGEHHPRVEFCCDLYITSNYQSENIVTIVVWNCKKQLENIERWKWLRSWRLKMWLKKMKKHFKAELQGQSMAVSFKAVVSYDQLKFQKD